MASGYRETDCHKVGRQGDREDRPGRQRRLTYGNYGRQRRLADDCPGRATYVARGSLSLASQQKTEETEKTDSPQGAAMELTVRCTCQH